MAVLLPCACGSTVSIEGTETAGSAVRCPACGKDVTVPDRARALEDTGQVDKSTMEAAQAALAAQRERAKEASGEKGKPPGGEKEESAAESLRNHRLRSVPGRQGPPGDPLAARLGPEPRSEAEHSCSTSETIAEDPAAVTTKMRAPVIVGDLRAPDAQLMETHRLGVQAMELCDLPGGGGGGTGSGTGTGTGTGVSPRAGASSVAELPALGPGQCPLCGMRNRAANPLCEGCGTDLKTGAPPSVERFRPRRFDSRIAIVAGVLLAAIGLGWVAALVVKAGADDRAIRRGQELARTGEWPEALAAYEDAARANPENGRAWIGIAEARLRLGRPAAEATEAAESAVRLVPPTDWPDAAAARYALGRARLGEGRIDEGARLFDDAARDRSELPGLRHWIGHARFLLKQSNEAVVAYEQAIATDPASPEAPLSRLRLGTLYGDRGKLPEAERTLEQALAGGAPKADVHVALGDLYSRRGDVPAAIAAYEESLAADGGRASTHYKIARLRFRTQDRKGARDALDRAIRLDDSAAEPWKLRGRILVEEGDPDRAAEAFREATGRDPEDAEAPFLLAELEAKRGDVERARAALAQALAAQPGYIRAHELSGRIAVERKEWRLAVDAYRKAVAADPTRADAWLGLATAYEALGQGADALNAYREAVQANRNHVQAWERLAAVHEQAGRTADLAQALGELARIQPDAVAPRLRLAKLQIGEKKYPPAKKLLEEVLKRDKDNAEAKALLEKVLLQEFMDQPQ